MVAFTNITWHKIPNACVYTQGLATHFGRSLACVPRRKPKAAAMVAFGREVDGRLELVSTVVT